MLIQSRTIVGAAAALAMVGAALWGSALLMAPQPHSARVEIQQIEERSWAVEVKDLSFEPAASDANRTAAVNR